MDDHTREKWLKVKAALEEAGKTDCFFYKKAVAALKGDKEPEQPLNFLF
jgi:hypothetical protein